MSYSQQNPWSNRPDAPNITYDAYFSEKAYLTGGFVCWMLYGIATVVFFRCMTGLFDPAHRRGERVKWGLVSYTTAMFSILTVLIAMGSNILSIMFIDSRQFPGVVGLVPPGPFGYFLYISPMAISVLPDVMVILNNWLADGLLLYRCYVIHSRNLWAIVFPFLMYLGSIATGILLIRRAAKVTGSYWPPVAYFSISVSLNVLLTLMIVIRIVLHTKATRAALGITGIGGLSKAIITMLIESCALHTTSSLLVLGPMGADDNPITNFFIPLLPVTQAIASLLIIQRVVNKSALTTNTIDSGHLSTLKARSRGSITGTNGALSGGGLTSWVDGRRVGSGELG